MSYYNRDVITDEVGSYQEKFMDYAHNWQDNDKKEKKRVKILHAPSKDESISFEDKINSYIEQNANSINIIDIKYQRSSIMIIYEPVIDK
jgi:hypothetical protein